MISIIYSVEVETEIGLIEERGYFANEITARQRFKEILTDARKQDSFANEEDSPGNGRLSRIDSQLTPERIMEAPVRVWETWSNENGTESEIVERYLILRKVELII